MSLLKKIFTNKTDQQVAQIQAENQKMAKEASKEARALRNLLRKNGVTLQIYIATGGDHRHG